MLHMQTATQSFQLPQYQSALLKKQKQSKILAPKVTHIHPEIKQVEKFKIKKHHLDDTQTKLALQYDYEEQGQPRQFVFRGSKLEYDKRDYVMSGNRKDNGSKDSIAKQRRVSNTLGIQSQQPNPLSMNYSTNPNALKQNSQYFEHPLSPSNNALKGYSTNRPQKDTPYQQSQRTVPKDNYHTSLPDQQNAGRLKKSLSVNELQLLRKDQAELQNRLISKLDRIEGETERVGRLLRDRRQQDKSQYIDYGNFSGRNDNERDGYNMRQRDSREVIKDIQERRQNQRLSKKQDQSQESGNNRAKLGKQPQPNTQQTITRYKSQTRHFQKDKLSKQKKDRPSHYEKDFNKLKQKLEKERVREKERLEVELRKIKEEARRMKEEERNRKRSFRELVQKQAHNQYIQTKTQTFSQQPQPQPPTTPSPTPNPYLQNLVCPSQPNKQRQPPSSPKLPSYKSLTPSSQQLLLQQQQTNLLYTQQLHQLQKKYLPKLNVVNKRIQCDLWDPNQERVRRYLEKPRFLYNDQSDTDDDFSDY